MVSHLTDQGFAMFTVIARKNGLFFSGEDVGPNGAGIPFVSLLYTGYALGDWPESRRARRWVCPDWDDLDTLVMLKDKNPNFANLMTNRQGRLTCELGIKMKPPSCPVLQGLALIHKAALTWDNPPSLGGCDLENATTSFGLVLPNLRESCWYAKMNRIFSLFAVATEQDLELRFS